MKIPYKNANSIVNFTSIRNPILQKITETKQRFTVEPSIGIGYNFCACWIWLFTSRIPIGLDELPFLVQVNYISKQVLLINQREI